ncbi:hypothetical protein N9W43_07080 [Litoricolaceae bacterium]|nr:hypothetical protein [Litorivicinaceae bacterium]
MATIKSDGELFLSVDELHTLETEFFVFETKLSAIKDEAVRGEILKLKWDYLMQRERLNVLEKDPNVQKRYKNKHHGV